MESSLTTVVFSPVCGVGDTESILVGLTCTSIVLTTEINNVRICISLFGLMMTTRRRQRDICAVVPVLTGHS
jgi:hypothetical protein